MTILFRWILPVLTAVAGAAPSVLTALGKQVPEWVVQLAVLLASLTAAKTTATVHGDNYKDPPA